MPLPQWISGNHGNSSWAGPHNVPPSKSPKSRPPQSLRDKVPFHGTLPKYSGPYSVRFFASVHQTAKAYCDTRSASSISRSLLHRLVLSPTSRATVDISCSSRPFSYLSTTPRSSDLAMAKTLGGISTGQEKSGFLILGQKCRKDTLLLLDYRNGWQ